MVLNKYLLDDSLFNTNNCLIIALLLIFRAESISENLVMPFHSDLFIDDSIEIQNHEDMYKALITPGNFDMLREVYNLYGIEMQVVEVIDSGLLEKNEHIMPILDLYECDWSRFYHVFHLEHMCVVDSFDKETEKSVIVDPMFSETGSLERKISDIAKNYIVIRKSRASYSVLESFIRSFEVQNQYRHELRSDATNTLKNHEDLFIDKSFSMDNIPSFIVTNYLKQLSEKARYHLMYLRHCSKSINRFHDLVEIEEKVYKLYQRSCFSLLRISLSEEKMAKRKVYLSMLEILDQIIELDYKYHSIGERICKYA